MAEEVSNELSGGNTYRFDKPILQNKMPPGRGGSTVIYVREISFLFFLLSYFFFSFFLYIITIIYFSLTVSNSLLNHF